jgi:hypothetical protein
MNAVRDGTTISEGVRSLGLVPGSLIDGLSCTPSHPCWISAGAELKLGSGDATIHSKESFELLRRYAGAIGHGHYENLVSESTLTALHAMDQGSYAIAYVEGGRLKALPILSAKHEAVPP